MEEGRTRGSTEVGTGKCSATPDVTDALIGAETGALPGFDSISSEAFEEHPGQRSYSHRKHRSPIDPATISTSHASQDRFDFL
jgi:hypothetical protein